MVSEEHITAFGWANYQDIDEILNLSLRVNDFLTGLFAGVGLRLIDFKLEYGRLWEDDDMRIVLADEISPDSCRLWDVVTNEKLDKDRFRRDLGRVEEGYQEAGYSAGGWAARSQRAGDRAITAPRRPLRREFTFASRMGCSTRRARRSVVRSPSSGSPASTRSARAK